MIKVLVVVVVMMKKMKIRMMKKKKRKRKVIVNIVGTIFSFCSYRYIGKHKNEKVLSWVKTLLFFQKATWPTGW